MVNDYGQSEDKTRLTVLEVSQRLKDLSVTILGLGGLGSNVAVALVRSHIGKLYLVDYDVVERSNLNRQYYFTKDIGIKKTEALKAILQSINPEVEVISRYIKVDEDNVLELCKNSTIIVEAFDDAKTKAMLINKVLKATDDKIIVSASGMAGYGDSNKITTKCINKRLYQTGDGVDPKDANGDFLAAKVAIAANHQANKVLELLLDSSEV